MCIDICSQDCCQGGRTLRISFNSVCLWSWWWEAGWLYQALEFAAPFPPCQHLFTIASFIQGCRDPGVHSETEEPCNGRFHPGLRQDLITLQDTHAELSTEAKWQRIQKKKTTTLVLSILRGLCFTFFYLCWVGYLWHASKHTQKSKDNLQTVSFPPWASGQWTPSPTQLSRWRQSCLVKADLEFAT